MDVLAGETKPDAGTVTWGRSAQAAYFPKDNTTYFATDKSVLEWLGASRLASRRPVGPWQRLEYDRRNSGFNLASLERGGYVFVAVPTDQTPTVCRCPLVGTWDAASPARGSDPEARASFVFDKAGTWIGGRHGEDAAATQLMSGRYTYAGGQFTITASEGMGCATDASAIYTAGFEAGCAVMTLELDRDACRTGRKYLGPGATRLTRRR